MTSLKYVTLLELKDSIIILPKSRDRVSEHKTKKNKKIVSLSNNLFDDLSNEISEIGFYRTTLNGNNMELRGGIKTKNINDITIYFSFKVNIEDFIKNVTEKFNKILTITESINYNVIKSNNLTYKNYISYKHLNNLKKFSEVFDLKEFYEECENLFNFDLNYANIPFSTIYNINTNKYRFEKLKEIRGSLFPVNLINLDFIDFKDGLTKSNPTRNNAFVNKTKFKLVCYLIKKLSKKEDAYRNFINSFEMELIPS